MWGSHSKAAASQAVGTILRSVSGVLGSASLVQQPSKPSADLPPLQPTSHWEQGLKPVRTRREHLLPDT